MRGWRARLRRILRFSRARPGSDPDLERVAQFWAERARERGDKLAPPGLWSSHPVVRAAINRRIGGHEDREWLASLRDYLPPGPVESALSLGCGGGQVEREAVALGLCQRIEAVDISPGAVELARELAHKAGMTQISYRVADLNHLTLPPASYDLVIAKQCLHHVHRLEHLLDQVRIALIPGGWFLVNEYVGPSRFQWTDVQLAIANRLLQLLPPRLRWLPQAGRTRDRVERPAPEEVIAVDPSEAVRSSDILPLLEERFAVEVRRDFGGTLLNPLLEGIIVNFDPEREEDNALLRALVTIEEILIEQGVLSSDFTALVARAHRGPRSSSW